MSSKHLHKGNESLSPCIITFILVLFIGSCKEVLLPAIVNARPIVTNDGDVAKVSSNNTFYSRDTSGEDNQFLPSEVQKAVCTVTAGDVKASAEAVTTKELKGVCQSSEINRAFSNLEQKISKDLEEIKDMLRAYINISSNDIKISAAEKPIVQFQPIPSGIKQQYDSNVISGHYDSKRIDILNETLLAPKREREILIYNNTLLSEKNVRVFTYYWKIENFTKRIKDGSGITEESSLFTIRGRAFKIKASFQHLHRDFVFLQLEDATLLSKSHNSISLETGGLFKEIETNVLRYKISVLQQNSLRKIKDLVSQDFDDHESGFLIPNSALLDSPFVKDDTIIVKIFLYL